MTSDSLNSRAVVRHAASQLASLTANTGNEPYTYSAFGTKAKGGTRTFLRAGAGVTASVLDDGNAKYTPGVSEVRSGTTTFSHSGLKSMGAQTDAGATPAVLATRTYDAFGATQSSSGTWQGAFGYAGAFGYQEEGSTLNLLGHRYYDASLGRFLTRDPIGDGSNRYAYCDNSPLVFTDPSGLKTTFGSDFGDFFAGMGDRISEGPPGIPFMPQPKNLLTTKLLRIALGVDDQVDYDSGWFSGGEFAGDAWWSALGGKAALPKVARLSKFDDAAAGAMAIIGETVERFPPVLARLPHLDQFNVPWTGFRSVMAKNVRWVLKHCLRGHDFVDLGLDLDRKQGRSPFYRAERTVIWFFEWP